MVKLSWMFAFAVVAMSAFAAAATCRVEMTGGATYGPFNSQVRAYFTGLPDDVTSATIACSASDAGQSVDVARITGNVYASRLCAYPAVQNATTFLATAEASDAKCSGSVSIKAVYPSAETLRSLLQSELAKYFGTAPVFTKTEDVAAYVKYDSDTVREQKQSFINGNPIYMPYYFSFYKILTTDTVDVEKERYIVGQRVLNESVQLVETPGMYGAYIQKIRYSCSIDGAQHNIVAYLTEGTTNEQINAVFAKIFDACYKSQAIFAAPSVPSATPSEIPSPSATPRATAQPTVATATPVPTSIATPTPAPIAAPAQDNSGLYLGVAAVAVLAGAAYWYFGKNKKEEGKKKSKRGA
ncbi:Uncharacterised protein [Candidatus Norongarragalina meridionalis]|nr:Uncharacterised protein [Candidatus Norongarragalina meridionalis]